MKSFEDTHVFLLAVCFHFVKYWLAQHNKKLFIFLKFIYCLYRNFRAKTKKHIEIDFLGVNWTK